MPKSETAEAPFTESYYGSLASMCREAGFEIKDCFLSNVLNFYPQSGRLSNATSEQIIESRDKLFDHLDTFKPNCIVLLGDEAAHVFKPDMAKLDNERGAPFMWRDTPCLITYHPKVIFARYSLNVLAIADLSKAHRYATEGWKPAEYNLNFQPTFQQAVELLNLFLEEKAYLSVDIETNKHLKMTCIGLGYNPTSALTIPFITENNKRYWPESEERQIWKLLAQVLETCPLVGHNAVHFDHKVLTTEHKIIPNFVSDTMFAHWECYSELLKSLAFCNALYTDNPYHKDVLKQARSGKIPYWEEYRYNATDTIVCFQCAYQIKKELADLPKEVTDHYRFNIRTSRAFQYMSIRGVDLDKRKLKDRVTQLNSELLDLQSMFNEQVGHDININSPKQVKTWLYDELKLPVQFKKAKDKDGYVEEKESSDYLSLLYLARSFPDIPAILTAARLRRLKKRISSLSGIKARNDGKVGWDFNCVGTETGRASGYIPTDGCGVQPQNVDRRDRDIFKAGDDEHWLKADLEGADSWTIAAMCSAMGDDTMMHDLLTGIKPAQALVIAEFFGKELITASPETLIGYKKKMKLLLAKEEEERGPGRTTYDVMKAVSHGSNYGMREHTMHDNIFKRSEGQLWISTTDCKIFQAMNMKRYPGLNKVHEQMVRIMKSHGFLDSFAGTRRYFFGRNDNVKVRAMLSHLPQAHTTYATNKLIERIYYWRENRRADGVHLRIEPVNQVHDETDLIFKKSELDFVQNIFWRMTDLEMECWGVKFRIPFEANYGPNWGDAKNELDK